MNAVEAFLKRDMRETLRRITFPLPEEQTGQGFKPNAYIRFLRRVARALIVLMRLNGRNRFSNELIQLLDPTLSVAVPGGEQLVFRMGHGRLLWRAKTFQSDEPMMMEWVGRFSPADCFYDVGANIGSYSLYAAKRGVRTFAFEPEFMNLQLLYENIFLNRVQELCTPIPIGLGASTSLELLYLKESLSKGDALHGIGRKSYMLGNPSTSTLRLHVLTARLDDLIEAFQLPPPTKLKIDVDGNELQVLRGAMNTLDGVEDVHLEVDDAQEESREAMELLEQKGFHLVGKDPNPLPWRGPNLWNGLFSRSAS
ncbi:MAG: FkbM family methyltransferase [Candidatus Omnitrophota bacterium]|nr:FkbM family methyltransferase [Candidatus Omnitrophota bacterium]